jgi:hypothetical protein
MTYENPDPERRFELISKALEIENDADMVKTIVENVANITIEEIANRDGEFEIFAKPSGITGKELNNLQELFRVREIGIYGDPEIPGENVYLHMIVWVNDN